MVVERGGRDIFFIRGDFLEQERGKVEEEKEREREGTEEVFESYWKRQESREKGLQERT